MLFNLHQELVISTKNHNNLSSTVHVQDFSVNSEFFIKDTRIHSLPVTGKNSSPVFTSCYISDVTQSAFLRGVRVIVVVSFIDGENHRPAASH
jgi:hypothetical protein